MHFLIGYWAIGLLGVIRCLQSLIEICNNNLVEVQADAMNLLGIEKREGSIKKRESGLRNEKWKMGNCDGTWFSTVLTCVLWALKSVPVQPFPCRIQNNSEKWQIMIFSIKLCIQYSKKCNFNFKIYKAQWCNSPKGRITSEGKLNLRLSRIDPRRQSTACYAMTRATTTTRK